LFEKWLDLPLRVGHNKTMPHEAFIIVTASVTVSLLAINFCQWKSQGRATKRWMRGRGQSQSTQES